jgi:hypothetical protein
LSSIHRTLKLRFSLRILCVSASLRALLFYFLIAACPRPVPSVDAMGENRLDFPVRFGYILLCYSEFSIMHTKQKSSAYAELVDLIAQPDPARALEYLMLLGAYP